MTTTTMIDGQGNIAVTTALATTQAIDMRAMRTAFIRSSADITGTFHASRNGVDYYSVKISGHVGPDYSMSLVSAYQPIDADLFPVHFLKIVGSGAANVEVMGKA
jgi:hypothetical protein